MVHSRETHREVSEFAGLARASHPAQVTEPQLEYTPVMAPRGRVVHALSLTKPGKTACGRDASGYRVALRPLDCQVCKEEVFYPVKLS